MGVVCGYTSFFAIFFFLPKNWSEVDGERRDEKGEGMGERGKMNTTSDFGIGTH